MDPSLETTELCANKIQESFMTMARRGDDGKNCVLQQKETKVQL